MKSSRRRITFETVREIAEQLAETEVSTAYGSPALKVNGRLYAGIAINKQAEPNSLMVYVAEEEPDTYYVRPHYESYPVVLIRLARVTRDALEDLLRGAHRIVSRKPPARRRTKRKT